MFQKIKHATLSFLVCVAFGGCVVQNVQELQTQAPITVKSEKIKQLVTDNNMSGNGDTSFLKNKKDNKSPLLTQPKVAKIIVEPYIDSDGDYHEEQKVHIKIEAAKFVDNPKLFSINEN